MVEREHEINPYSAPKPQETVVDALEYDPRCFRFENFLIANEDSVLPNTCVKCGAAAKEKITLRFSDVGIRSLTESEMLFAFLAVAIALCGILFFSFWVAVSLVVLSVFAMIVYVCWNSSRSQRCEIRFGLCEKHQRARRYLIYLFAAYAAFPLGSSALRRLGLMDSDLNFVPMLVVIVAIVAQKRFGLNLRAKKFIDDRAWIVGCHPTLLDSLQELRDQRCSRPVVAFDQTHPGSRDVAS